MRSASRREAVSGPECAITGEVVPVEHSTIYAAGLFDGEGCVYLGHSLSRGRPQWWMTAVIKMADREPLELLQARWGGRLYDHSAKPNRKRQTSWRIMSRQAAAFLSAIEPHVQTVRRRKAICVALSFQAQKRSPGPRGVTDEYRQLQHDFMGLMRALNKRGGDPQHAGLRPEDSSPIKRQATG